MPTQERKKGFRRSKKEWEESVSLHVGKFIDKLTMDDLVKLSMFFTATWFSKEIGILRAEPIFVEPTPEQEAKNWLANALVGYLIVYKPEAVVEALKALGKIII